MSSDDMMGLEPTLFLSANARVMITSNIWLKAGLVNGATGSVRHIIFKPGTQPPTMPLVVVVEMDKGYRGPSIPNKIKFVICLKLIFYFCLIFFIFKSCCYSGKMC